MKKVVTVLMIAVTLVAGITTISTSMNQKVEAMQLSDPGRGG